jgi:hypothetical protein
LATRRGYLVRRRLERAPRLTIHQPPASATNATTTIAITTGPASPNVDVDDAGAALEAGPGAPAGDAGDPDGPTVGAEVGSAVGAGVARGGLDGTGLPLGKALPRGPPLPPPEAGGGTTAVVKFAQRYSRVVSFESWISFARSRPT